MADTPDPPSSLFVAPSDEQVHNVGMVSRKVEVKVIDTFNFFADSLAEAIAGYEYVRRMLEVMRVHQEQQQGKTETTGLHGEDCNCEVIITRLFGDDVPEPLRRAMDAAKRQHHARGN